MTEKIPICGQRGADTGPPLVVRPRGEALRAIRPYAAIGGAGSHISQPVRSDLAKIDSRIAQEIRRVADAD